jgi:hypothetical protein
MSNYELISSRYDNISQHLYFFDEKCLFVKNGVKNKTQYYRCVGENKIENRCKVTGKVVNNKFIRINEKVNFHNHENHEERAASEKLIQQIKLDVENHPETPIRTLFVKKCSRYFLFLSDQFAC